MPRRGVELSTESADVAVVGAGVAGAAAACALARAGLRTVVYERRHLDRDANRGDALHADAVARVESWDALPALENRGAFWVRRSVFTTPRGQPRLEMPLNGGALLMLAHSDIELGLAETAEQYGAEVRDQAVREAHRDGDGWRIVTKKDEELRVRLLVGADGARSLVREAAGIPVDSHQFGQSTVVLHAPLPDWLDDECGFATIHPDGGVLILPTTPRGLCRVVAQVDDDDLPRWRSADPAELRELLGARDSRLGELDVQRYTGSHVYRLGWQHARRYVAPGLALVGDAAHVTHPNGGQGMTLAVYDAAALGQVVAPALTNGDRNGRSLTAALWEYAARRRMPSWESLERANRVARFQRKGVLPYAGSVAMLGLFSISPSVTARLARRFGGE